MQNVKLLVVHIDVGFRYRDYLLKSISNVQKEKVLRYKSELDQVRSLLSSYLINQLSNEELLFTENGKPYFKSGPLFNVSHSGKYVVMAISNKEVGVDIEENVPKNMSTLLPIFNEVESKMIKEHADFYYMWCSKESLIKCMALSVGKVREISSLPLNGVKTYKGQDYYSKAFIYDHHIVSITLEGNEEFDVDIEKVEHIPFII